MKKLLVTAILGFSLSAAANAHAAYRAVLVECISDANCADLTLQTVCGGTMPVNISCTQVRTPTVVTECNEYYNTALCGTTVIDYDSRVGNFCKDVNGYDAIVTCLLPSP